MPDEMPVTGFMLITGNFLPVQRFYKLKSVFPLSVCQMDILLMNARFDSFFSVKAIA